MLVNTYISLTTGSRRRFSCPAKVNSIFKWQHRHDKIIAKVIILMINSIVNLTQFMRQCLSPIH